MTAPSDGVPLFVQLLGLNRQLFTAGDYNPAYHLLAAAFYVAGEDTQYLAMVEQVAEEQLTEIDAVHPEYEHSTASTAAHGGRSIFRVLARQAQTQLGQVELRRLLQEPPRNEGRPLRPAPEHGSP
jgi:hypothetical protein